MASEAAPFDRRRSRTSPYAFGDHGLGVLGPHEGEGVRTGGRLHPGRAGERLLKPRPKVLKLVGLDGLVCPGAFGDDPDHVSEFIATAPVELRRATDPPGIVTQNCANMVQTLPLHVVVAPFGTLLESADHDPSASFGRAASCALIGCPRPEA